MDKENKTKNYLTVPEYFETLKRKGDEAPVRSKKELHLVYEQSVCQESLHQQSRGKSYRFRKDRKS